MNIPLIQLTNSLLESVSNSFDYRRILPFEKTSVLASDDQSAVSADIVTLSQRLYLRNIKSSIFSDLYLKYKLDSTRVLWFNEERKKVKNVQMNHDLLPAALYYNLLYWNSSLSPNVYMIYSWFEKSNIIFWSILIILVLMGYYFLIVRKQSFSKASIVLSIFSTGITGMGITIVFLLTFQAFYGYVYFWIGIIISSFMVGLSLGGFWGSTRMHHISNLSAPFIKIEGTLAGYLISVLLLLAVIPDLMSSNLLLNVLPYLLLVIIFLCGSLVGIQFSVANQLYLSDGKHYTQTAGLLYASDLLGAWAGSLLITLVLIPILGTIETIVILLIIKIGSTLIYAMSRN
jgi:spermidine synthase